jgi:purine-binding chemotaxis protein CheW
MNPTAADPAPDRGARTLREQFDRSFALAPALPPVGSVNLLTIRIGAEPYAIRLADIRGLHADRRILPLPGPMRELLGVTGFRGQIVPVYQLATMLGLSGAAAPRWMVLALASAPLAFAFDAFETHICAAAHQLIASGDSTERPCEAVRTDAGVVPVLPLQELVERIERCTAQAQRSDNG